MWSLETALLLAIFVNICHTWVLGGILMATLNISLPDPMRTWIQERVDEGKYSTSSDYVRDLIRRDQDRKQKIKAMQQAITQGLESEDVNEFDMKAFTKRMLKESQIDG